MTINWDDLNEGDSIPELKQQPGITQLVKYAAGSGDFNPLHHDYNFLQSKEIGSIIVHGRFKYAALGELVSNWLAHNGRIREISCQYRGMDFPDKEMTLKGIIKKKWKENDEKRIDLKIWVEDDEGKITTPGKALISF